MHPPYNPGKADGDIDISASRLHMELKFSGMVKETCIFNLNIKVIHAVKSSHSQKQKNFHQGGPHVSTYSICNLVITGPPSTFEKHLFAKTTHRMDCNGFSIVHSIMCDVIASAMLIERS